MKTALSPISFAAVTYPTHLRFVIYLFKVCCKGIDFQKTVNQRRPHSPTGPANELEMTRDFGRKLIFVIVGGGWPADSEYLVRVQ
jgi:hypothetical protein